jgi:hypothetical protein
VGTGTFSFPSDFGQATFFFWSELCTFLKTPVRGESSAQYIVKVDQGAQYSQKFLGMHGCCSVSMKNSKVDDVNRCKDGRVERPRRAGNERHDLTAEDANRGCLYNLGLVTSLVPPRISTIRLS